jgi:hypothetical protein
MRANPAADASVRISLSLLILIQKSGARMAFFDTRAASDALIGIDHRQIMGRVGNRRNHFGNGIAATAAAAITNTGFFLGCVEIGMVGFMHQSVCFGSL